MSVTLAGATKSLPVRQGLSRRPKVILDAVSVEFGAGEFIGLLGASGSGKSTLIKSIAGLITLTDGSVAVDGETVSAARLRGDHRIAYLPQDVIVHEQLTPRRALGYTLRLKGLGHGRKDRNRLVHDALERVGLGERMNTPIRQLSGGQRKRVALASELLGEPQLILLDEATSGLDPASEADMMHLFRSLADEGRTVICITHSPERLELCDRLLYLMNGRSVFFGTPTDLKRFFGVDVIEQVYRSESRQSPEEWQRAFLATQPDERAPVFGKTALIESGSPLATKASKPAGPLTQLRILLRRYADIQLGDWKSLLLILLQAPVIALMVSAVFGEIPVPFVEQHAASTKELIFVLVLAVLWCSGTLSVREIVKEQSIFQHESRLGVRVLPYAGSKLLVLGTLALMQALILLYVVREFTGLTGNVATQTSVVMLLAVVGVALGLLVSAVAVTSERAMTLLPVILIAQAIFSGGMSRLSDMVLRVSEAVVPAYWALDGLRASFSSALMFASYPGPPGTFQRPILGTGGPLAVDMLALVLQGAAFFAVTCLALHLQRR